jgi:hypothetical protein
LREVLQIQLLRSHFDSKMRARRAHASREARIFAICDAPCDSINFKQNGKQKPLLSLPAAREGFI